MDVSGQPFFLDSGLLKVGTIDCIEMSANNDPSTPRNITEERISHLHCGGRLVITKEVISRRKDVFAAVAAKDSAGVK
jgi:hypothetical protein